MRLNLQPFTLPPGTDPLPPWGDNVLKWIHNFVIKSRQFIDSAGLGFGDGTNVDNIFGAWVTYTTNATPNTEDAVTHNLGVVPVGFLVMNLNKAGVVYQSGTSWTKTQIFLKCSVASTTVLLFILGPSNQNY